MVLSYDSSSGQPAGSSFIIPSLPRWYHDTPEQQVEWQAVPWCRVTCASPVSQPDSEFGPIGDR